MRPRLRLLSDELIREIVGEARSVLSRLGVEIHNDSVVRLLQDHGARAGAGRVFIDDELVDRALAAAPREFRLYDVLGRPTHHFAGDEVHFTPGSAAIHVLDEETGEIRKPATRDLVRFYKLVSQLPHIAASSTAIIAADVHEKISDSYRLHLSLLHCEKPVVTGAFTAEAFGLMKDLQVAVRGDARRLEEQPLTVFSCCPTSPLKWSYVTSQNLVDCARSLIPAELISMPLAGFMAPVTLVGSLVQHTAETLSGVVIAQCARPGAPLLYGGSPASFDIRYETTPMGAVETQMLDCAYAEVAKHLGLPTQAYIALSDAKALDAQAGMESAMGATLAALAGINSVSGPGMLDFESCQSLEKLVLDNEICGMALRLARGVEPREDFPALPHFEELLRDKHLLIARHTRRHLKAEHYFPGPVVDRANLSRWRDEGGLSLAERARREVRRLVAAHAPTRLPADTLREITRLMTRAAREVGMDALPESEA